MAAILTEEFSEKIDGSSQYDKVIDLLKLTLKVVIIMNGGAAIALLTLIGRIWSSGSWSYAVTYLGWAIAFFGFGVLSGAIAIAMGYRAEYNDYQYNECFRRVTKDNISDELKAKQISLADMFTGLRTKYFILADRSVISSFVLFGIGIVFCTLAILT